MNYPDEKNPHTVETKYSTKVYWKAGTASGVDGADRVELRCRGQWPTLDFALPRQQHELGRVEALMHEAYVRGIADAKREMGKLFREIIAL